MHYKLTLCYDGTAYCGWQVQPNAPTVCSTLQDAVEAVYKTRYDIKGCSRTDSGVHANGFVAALKTAESLPPDAVLRALNVHLPRDIAVTACEEAPENFHPRYDVVAKRYLYRIYDAPVRDPFREGRALHHPHRLDDAAMAKAAALFCGQHNFSAFCSAGGKIPEEERIRTIYRCSVTRAGDDITLSVTGDGFLYNMVRIMAGTMTEIGEGRRSAQEITKIIASRDRARAGITAPPEGLYLDAVFYDEKEAGL